MKYVKLCPSCASEWRKAGLIESPSCMDMQGVVSVCDHCGKTLRCVWATYIGKYKLKGGKG